MALQTLIIYATAPFWHEPLYLAKVLLSGHSGLLPLPVARYGHCNFTTNELLTAFALTVQ